MFDEREIIDAVRRVGQQTADAKITSAFYLLAEELTKLSAAKQSAWEKRHLPAELTTPALSGPAKFFEATEASDV